jgi:hypothetical protein
MRQRAGIRNSLTSTSGCLSTRTTNPTLSVRVFAQTTVSVCLFFLTSPCLLSRQPMRSFVACACAGAWTQFVKTSFAKHSPTKKAPSPSLARSIFVTWLNGVPYDTHDSPFLDEMKLSAAQYQTHSLAIANSHYDKDVASEAKLRELVDFCDKYAAWSGSSGDATAASTLASSSSAPLAGRASVASATVPSSLHVPRSPASPVAASSASSASAPDSRSPASSSDDDVAFPGNDGSVASSFASASSGAGSESSSVARSLPRLRSAGTSKPGSDEDSNNEASSDDDDDDDDNNDKLGAGGAGVQGLSKGRKKATKKQPRSRGRDGVAVCDAGNDNDNDKVYWPERIVAKKTVRGQDLYLIHWRGFSESDRTWEPAAFFDQHCTAQTYAYEQSRVAVQIVSQRSKGATTECVHLRLCFVTVTGSEESQAAL